MKNKLGEDSLLTGETNLLFLSFFGFVLFRFFFFWVSYSLCHIQALRHKDLRIGSFKPIKKTVNTICLKKKQTSLLSPVY